MQSDSVFRDITNSSTEQLIESICKVNFNHSTEENTEMGINLSEKVKQMTEFYIQKGVTQGRQEGSILGCIATMRSLNYTQAEILEKLKELYSLSVEQAMPYMESAPK